MTPGVRRAIRLAICTLIAVAVVSGFNRALDILPARLFLAMADQGRFTAFGYAFTLVCIAIGVALLGLVWGVCSKALGLAQHED